MPPICYHLALAQEAARRLALPLLERNMGSYLLGSTLPDIHIMTQTSREETHFFDLTSPDPRSGAEALFEGHPELGRGSALDEGVRALVAGYLCHLVTDEVWIMDVYRPFFGRGTPWGNDPMANIWDRALQYELDRRACTDQATMVEIRSHLAKAIPAPGLSLVDRASLEEWCHFVAMATSREATWEGFAVFAHKFLLPQAKVSAEQLERFLASLPQGLEWTLHQVGEARLAAFREKAIAQSMRVAQEYLNAHSQG